MRQREREPDPSRGDVAPGFRQQPHHCEDPLVDARKLADDELAAQPLHLVGEALVQRRDQTRARVVPLRGTPSPRSARRTGAGARNATSSQPRRRGVVGLNEEIPGPEQLDSGLLADLQGRGRVRPSSSAAAKALCRRSTLSTRERPGAGMDHGQRDADSSARSSRHQATRQLELGVEQWDSVRGGHRSADYAPGSREQGEYERSSSWCATPGRASSARGNARPGRSSTSARRPAGRRRATARRRRRRTVEGGDPPRGSGHPSPGGRGSGAARARARVLGLPDRRTPAYGSLGVEPSISAGSSVKIPSPHRGRRRCR